MEFATLILLYGQSGTGKSTGLRKFSRDEISVINVSGKPMPFRNSLMTWTTDDYKAIIDTLPKIKTKVIVIDDATYLMVDEFMRNAKVQGYQKYTDIAKNFNDLIEAARKLPADKTVYFIGHSEQSDDGREHFKTIGKMLDNYVTVEGKFSIVLKTVVKDGHYYFSTQNNGYDTVKTPMGMFNDELIDNDLKMVDDTIREYYGITSKEGDKKDVSNKRSSSKKGA